MISEPILTEIIQNTSEPSHLKRAPHLNKTGNRWTSATPLLLKLLEFVVEWTRIKNYGRYLRLSIVASHRLQAGLCALVPRFTILMR